MLLAACVSLILAGIILSAAYLHAWLFAILPGILFLFWRMNDKNRLALILMTLPFPLVIPFLGKDGGTVTTLLILFLAALAAFERWSGRKQLQGYKIEPLIYGLALIGAVSFITSPLGVSITSIRYFYIYLSGLLLFLMVIKHPGSAEMKTLERFMEILVFIAALQVSIGILLYFYPQARSWFDLFLKADREFLDLRENQETVRRLRTLITGPEPTGEMLAVLAPLVLGRALANNSLRHFGYFLLFFAGEMLTATRSTILLFAAGSAVTLMYFTARVHAGRGLKFIGASVVGLAVLMAAFPGLTSGFFERSLEAKTLARTGGGLSEILNRDEVWANAERLLKQTPLTGNGFLPPSYLGETQNFHNLYLTLIFQLGWAGAPFYILALGAILVLLWRKRAVLDNSESRFMVAVCIVSMSLFLVNEIKYEFNRHQPYSQFCWALFAVFYLMAQRPVTHDQKL